MGLMNIVWGVPLTDCWCGFRPEVYRLADANGSTSKAIYAKHVSIHQLEDNTRRLKQCLAQLRQIATPLP